MKPPVVVDPWRALRAHTPARIALGRAGESLPTDAVLAFGLAHAQARDAVHVELDVVALRDELLRRGHEPLLVDSAAGDRAHYLRRPDLGRRLCAGDRERLIAHAAAKPANPDLLSIVIADGLSALAVQRHALPVLEALLGRLGERPLAPLVVARQGRVALGDEIGELLGAQQVVVLIGERPGLSAPDSLGIYLTHAPRIGRSDAERNCISNVRAAGLGYAAAADRLVWLLDGARRLGASGVRLKDESGAAHERLALDGGATSPHAPRPEPRS